MGPSVTVNGIYRASPSSFAGLPPRPSRSCTRDAVGSVSLSVASVLISLALEPVQYGTESLGRIYTAAVILPQLAPIG